jgi:hypothetical protein
MAADADSAKLARQTTVAAVVTVAVLVLVAIAIWRQRPRFEAVEVSQQTTYIITPTRADGWVDYPEAVDWMRRAGLDAGGANAALPLLRALGRDVLPLGVDRDALLKRMGVNPPGGDVPTLKPLKDFDGAGKAGAAPEPPPEVMDWLRPRCAATAAQAPSLARVSAWLAASGGALADLRTAAQAASLYVPVARDARAIGNFDRVNAIRLADAVQALSCHAAVTLLEGDAPASWNDADALWRLGQLLARSATSSEYASAETLWRAALQATVDMVASPRTGADLLSAMQAGLGAKLGFPPATDSWMFQRLEALEVNGTPMLAPSPPGRQPGGPRARVGTTATLTAINQEYDTFDVALQGGSGMQRIARIEQAAPAGGFTPRASALRTLAVEVRAVSEHRIASLAVTLGRRQRDGGKLPASLAELRGAPVDPGDAAPFHYVIERGGFRLFGVGGDGLDNAGDPETDVVAAALPPPPAAAAAPAP